jgi:hypothetical protein
LCQNDSYSNFLTTSHNFENNIFQELLERPLGIIKKVQSVTKHCPTKILFILGESQKPLGVISGGKRRGD